jgi:hypothetical protein
LMIAWMPLARVNTSAQPAKVNDVLFKEMLLQ